MSVSLLCEIEKGEALFARMTPAQQDAKLGQAAGAAYRAGAVKLIDFVGVRRDPDWGDTRYVKSLRQVLGREEAQRWVRKAQQQKTWQAVSKKIGELTDRKAVLSLGELPTRTYQAFRQQWPSSVTAQVVLTGERRAHYLERHPEMAAFEGKLMETLFAPDEIHRNKRDSQIGIWYRRLNGSQYIRVVVWVSDTPGLQNSIHSFRLADQREIDQGQKQKRLVWAKSKPLGGSALSHIPLACAGSGRSGRFSTSSGF